MASRWRCHATKAQTSAPPPAITNTVREKPNGSTGESFGFSSPHVLDCRVPRTIIPSPAAASTLPTRSRRGAGPVRGLSFTRGVMARMKATSTTSPTKTIRQESSVVAQPPRMGPMAMPAPATPPITA